MADENKKQTAILESVLGELRKSNAMKREESGGDALVGGIPFGSAQCLYIGSCNRLRNKRNKSYLANAS